MTHMLCGHLLHDMMGIMRCVPCQSWAIHSSCKFVIRPTWLYWLYKILYWYTVTCSANLLQADPGTCSFVAENQYWNQAFRIQDTIFCTDYCWFCLFICNFHFQHIYYHRKQINKGLLHVLFLFKQLSLSSVY